MQHDTLREGVLEGRIDTRDEETANMRVSHRKQSGFLCLAGQSAIQHKRFPVAAMSADSPMNITMRTLAGYAMR